MAGEFPQIEAIAGSGRCSLTIEAEGLRCKYHLRSQSGSSGPIAKEESPLLGWRPILVSPNRCGFAHRFHVATSFLQKSAARIPPARERAEPHAQSLVCRTLRQVYKRVTTDGLEKE